MVHIVCKYIFDPHKAKIPYLKSTRILTLNLKIHRICVIFTILILTIYYILKLPMLASLLA